MNKYKGGASPKKHRNLWQEHVYSFRTSDVTIQCRPSNAIVLTSIPITLAAVCKFVPEIARVVGLSSDLGFIGPLFFSILSLFFLQLTWRLRTLNRSALALTILLGSMFHGLSALSLAYFAAPPSSYLFAGLFVFICLHWGRFYALSLPSILAMAIIPSTLMTILDETLLLRILTVVGGLFFTLSSWNSSKRRNSFLEHTQVQTSAENKQLLENERRQYTTADISVWQHYLNSRPNKEVSLDRRPTFILTLSIFLAALAVAADKIDPLHSFFSLKQPLIPTLTLIGAAICSFFVLVFQNKNRSVSGGFTLLQTLLLSIGISALASLTKNPAGYFLGLVYVILAYLWGKKDSITTLGGISAAVAPVVTTFGLTAEIGCKFLIAFGALVFLYMANTTKKKRDSDKKLVRSTSMLKRLDSLLLESRAAAVRKIQLEMGTTFHKLKNELGPAMWNLTAASSASWTGTDAAEALEESLGLLRNATRTVERHLENVRADSYDKDEEIWLPESNLILSVDRKSAQAKGGAQIEVETMPRVSVPGTEDDLRLVLRNLTDNAVEAGAKRIDVGGAVLAGGTLVSIVVNDNGPGIINNFKDKIFEPYVTHNKPHGVGLGLYLSRRIIEGMGGMLLLSDTGSKGTTFEIRLPIKNTKSSTTPAQITT